MSTGKLCTLLVDDEPLARSNLRALLSCQPDIHLIGECSSGTEALTRIRETHPAIVFLDIQMPECDGFDVLEMLGADTPPAIVFVTAYDQYALRAFDAGVLDYLLKPFDDARFHLALDRARQRVLQSSSTPRKSNTITLKSAGQVLFLKLSEIDWIEAADYYSCLHVGTRSHLLRRSMQELEDELDPALFCRIHRSTIVQLDRVRGLKLNESGEHDVLLTDGTTLHSSRRYRKQLQDRLATLTSS